MMLRSKIVYHAILIFFVWPSTGFGAEGVEWGRLRLAPKLSVAEQYSDNVFLTEKDEQDEYITTISPQLSVGLALATRNIFSLSYGGDFRFYSEFDNLRKDHHQGGLSWTCTMPGGSEFAVGAEVQDSSIQPYSGEGRHKDFVKQDAFADALLKLGAFIEVGLRYDHTSRRFDSSLDEIDEFDRDGVAVDIFFKHSPATALLLEYSYYYQDNNDLDGPSTDMDTHTVFVGARWDLTARLSGTLKVGCTQTDFEEVSDFSGFATDTDLLYRFSDITTFKLSAYRRVVRSTRAGRESGNYFVSSGGSLSAMYNGWDTLGITLDFSYKNDDFQQQDARDRKDNRFQAGLETKYSMQDRLSFLLRYQHTRNDSNFATVDYTENRVEARFSLFI